MESNYTKIPNEFIRLCAEGTFNRVEMHLFLLIASKINHKTGDCRIKVSTIRESIKVSREYLLRSRKKLQKMGFLEFRRLSKEIFSYTIKTGKNNVKNRFSKKQDADRYKEFDSLV